MNQLPPPLAHLKPPLGPSAPCCAFCASIITWLNESTRTSTPNNPTFPYKPTTFPPGLPSSIRQKVLKKVEYELHRALDGFIAECERSDCEEDLDLLLEDDFLFGDSRGGKSRGQGQNEEDSEAWAERERVRTRERPGNPMASGLEDGYYLSDSTTSIFLDASEFIDGGTTPF